MNITRNSTVKIFAIVYAAISRSLGHHNVNNKYRATKHLLFARFFLTFLCWRSSNGCVYAYGTSGGTVPLDTMLVIVAVNVQIYQHFNRNVIIYYYYRKFVL